VKKNRLYIYLAGLDKKGIEVVAAFPSTKKIYPTRIRDMSSLGMDPSASRKVSASAYEKRMTHELFAESAQSFEELKESLRRRGYSSLPMQQFTGYTKPTKVDERSLITKSATMLQRAKK
jgi:hypothetical protein